MRCTCCRIAEGSVLGSGVRRQRDPDVSSCAISHLRNEPGNDDLLVQLAQCYQYNLTQTRRHFHSLYGDHYRQDSHNTTLTGLSFDPGIYSNSDRARSPDPVAPRT